MEGRGIAKLFGVVSAFLFLLYVFLITTGTECFNVSQLFVTYALIVYTIIMEIYDLLVPRLKIQ